MQRILRICIAMLVFLLLILTGCHSQEQTMLLEELPPADGQEASEVEEADSPNNQIDAGRPDAAESDGQNISDAEEDVDIYVFVCGQVADPGVYSLKKGSRVCDAIAKAGGCLADADIPVVNQARLLTDGEKIYIPKIGEDYVEAEPVEDAIRAGTEGTDHPSSDLVDVNRATKDELLTLPGIGESKAEAILTYRESHGSFQTKEELMNIAGIKEGVFQKIEPYITIE